ncbi:hypothetical protein C8Q75DRAFT_470918 [Abortiporus biennis]|nr:hypothetical protein C8Q75DRAFT_470918 [Abortiporus biennis]
MVAAGLSLLRIYDMPTAVSTDDPQASLVISSLSLGILSRSLESRDSLSTVELDSVSTGYSKDNVIVHADWRIYFYFIFQIVGAIGLTVLLVTMLWPSKQRKPRNPLLLSLCFSWWISTFPCLCLLYYTGQVTGPPPSFGVCLSSAALTMAQQVLVATTAPALVFHVWLVVKKAVSARFSGDNWMYWTTIICVSVPYVLFLIFAGATIGMGLKEPDLVYRVVFYCTVNDIQLMEALGVVGTCGMVISVVFEIWTVLLLRRNKARIQQLSKDRTTFDMSLIIRVCIFGIYVLLGLCLNIISIIDWANSCCLCCIRVTARRLAYLEKRPEKHHHHYFANAYAFKFSRQS